jgi:integrase
VTRFLRWAIKTRLVSPDLTTRPHRRGTSPKLGAASQDTAIQQVVHGGELSARDRLAAILVIVFGQQIADVVGLTWTDVTLTGELATITLGTTAIALPPPLDDPLRQLARIPRTARHRRTPTARGSSAATSPDSTSPPRASGNGSPGCSPPAPPGWERCTN